MSEDTDDKRKRAGKRYTYSRAAQCQIENDTFEVQMLNISASGIQFATRTKIETKDAIRVLWKDSQFGSFNPTVLIVREVHKPENPDYQYYYGSQYYNLESEVKANLLKLLKHFKEEDRRVVEQEVSKITPIRLFDIIEQGREFLRQVFSGGETTPYFSNVLKEVTDYEKAAFLLNDDASFCIQKLATYNFHCNLLGMTAPMIMDSPESVQPYFQHILIRLQKITESESEVDGIIRQLLEKKDEEAKATQKRLNESSNRLFYTKQALLQTVVETFANVDSNSHDFKNTLGKIKEEYEKILEFTNASSGGYETLTYTRKAKIDETKKVEEVVDVPIYTDTGPRYTTWFLGFIILLIGAGFGYSYINDVRTRKEIGNQIKLPIKIIDDRRVNTQMDLVVRSEDWNKLKKEEKVKIYNQIHEYLQKKRFTSCILFNESNNIIHTVYRDIPVN